MARFDFSPTDVSAPVSTNKFTINPAPVADQPLVAPSRFDFSAPSQSSQSYSPQETGGDPFELLYRAHKAIDTYSQNIQDRQNQDMANNMVKKYGISPEEAIRQVQSNEKSLSASFGFINPDLAVESGLEKFMQATTELQGIKDTLASHPGRDLLKYTISKGGELPEIVGGTFRGLRQGVETKFGKFGDDILKTLGFDNEQEAQQAVDSYKSLVQRRNQLTDYLKVSTPKVERAAVRGSRPALEEVPPPPTEQILTENQRVGPRENLANLSDADLRALDQIDSSAKSIAEAPQGVKPPAGRGGVTPPELNFAGFKDKSTFALTRETLERNIEDVAGQDAAKLKQFITEPIKVSETARVAFDNSLRQQTRNEIVNNLGIRAGSKEDALIQRFGEKRISLQDLKTESPKKWQQIEQASKFFRQKYDELLNMVNESRAKFGYKPIPKREDYFRHFQEIGSVIKQFGLILREQDLPTEIAGLTDLFKPGKPFSTAELQRKGGMFTESAIRGFDNYIDSISRQIFHIDSVQRGRALEKYIRQAGANGQANLPNFVANLSEYTNLLSGKKAKFDRAFESVFGRPFYGVINFFRTRTAANLIGGNVGSALTNFIPLTQSLATTDKLSFVRGLYEAMAGPLQKDFSQIAGEKSGFLARRFKEEVIDPTKFQKVQEIANWLFQAIDKFASRAIVSGKYFEGLKSGLQSAEAMRQADNYAGRVITDRSLGQLPNLMGSRTLGVLTQFQTEINNAYSFLVKDIPRMNQGNPAKIVSAIGQFLVYSYAFNSLFEKATGRRPTLDPLYAVLTTAGINNAGENQPFGQRVLKTAQDLGGNLPFVGGITGGRFPISAGLPNLTNVLTGRNVKKELLKPAFLLAPPIAGLQAKKTLEGLVDYSSGQSTTPTGKTRYTIKKDTANLARGAFFGRNAFPEAQQYYNQKTQVKTKTRFSF